jgi:alanine racemase
MGWSFPTRPTRALVDLGALLHNLGVARRCAGAREVIAVVKADAYGHGAVPVVRALASAGCARFAVATLSEVAELRGAGIGAPLLLLGGIQSAAEADAALALGATPVLHHDAQRAWIEAAAARAGRRADVHVEIDSGMHRMGAPPADAVALVARVAASRHLSLGGVATHFARADEADPAPTRAQVEVFAAALDDLKRRGVESPCVHLANSAGLLASGAWHDLLPGDAVRPGLMLYGVAPAPHQQDAGLRPVMTLATAVAALRRVESGAGVGYAASWRAPRSGWVATLPMGYADGIPWSISGGGAAVLIAGRPRPVVGRVSMDLITVWLEDDEVSVGEPAIAFGTGAGGSLRVEALAAAAGTLAYELLVRVGARVPRVYVAA